MQLVADCMDENCFRTSPCEWPLNQLNLEAQGHFCLADCYHPSPRPWGFLSLSRPPNSENSFGDELPPQSCRRLGWIEVQLQDRWAKVHFNGDLWSPGTGPSVGVASWYALCQAQSKQFYLLLFFSHAPPVSYPRDVSGYSRTRPLDVARSGKRRAVTGWILQSLWMSHSLAAGKTQCKFMNSAWEVAVKWEKNVLNFFLAARIKAENASVVKKTKCVSCNKNKNTFFCSTL